MTARQSNVDRLAGIVITGIAIYGVLIAIKLAALLSGIETPRDATDSATARSGMVLLTDYGTGCQYLSRPGAGLTVRLGRDGRPLCGGNP